MLRLCGGAVVRVNRARSSGAARTQSGHTPGFCSLYKRPLRAQGKMVPGEVWKCWAAIRTETSPSPRGAASRGVMGQAVGMACRRRISITRRYVHGKPCRVVQPGVLSSAAMRSSGWVCARSRMRATSPRSQRWTAPEVGRWTVRGMIAPVCHRMCRRVCPGRAHESRLTSWIKHRTMRCRSAGVVGGACQTPGRSVPTCAMRARSVADRGVSARACARA